MEPTNQQSASAPSQTPFSTPTQSPVAPAHKKVGPIITILVIVLILIIGALYFFASGVNNAPATQDTTAIDTSAAADESAEVTPVTNQSDDVSSIESDLNASINGVDNQNF